MKKYDTILEDAYNNSKSATYGKAKHWIDSPWKSKGLVEVFPIYSFAATFQLAIKRSSLLESSNLI
jgi:hypothetical protein